MSHVCNWRYSSRSIKGTSIKTKGIKICHSFWVQKYLIFYSSTFYSLETRNSESEAYAEINPLKKVNGKLYYQQPLIYKRENIRFSILENCLPPLRKNTAENTANMFFYGFLRCCPAFEVLEARECFQRLPGGGTLRFHRLWARGEALRPETCPFSSFSCPSELTCWSRNWLMVAKHWFMVAERWWLVAERW